jgi:uncharacterized membrane protein YdbT with pleckstrin-like domain
MIKQEAITKRREDTMGNYVESVLGANERVEIKAGIHWAIYLRPAWVTFFMLVIRGVLQGAEPPPPPSLDILLFGIAGLSWLRTFIRAATTELAVTNRRVIAKTGFISRKADELQLNRVEGARLDQTVMGRIMGYGTITVTGTGGGTAPLRFIAQPVEFRRALNTLLSEPTPIPARTEPAPSSQPSASPPLAAGELAGLRQEDRLGRRV